MEYRELNEEYQPSLLGFGCMRFPLDAQGNIDEAEAERMLDTAIAHGVKYIDTAFPYHHGDSEPFVGRVLKRMWIFICFMPLIRRNGKKQSSWASLHTVKN